MKIGMGTKQMCVTVDEQVLDEIDRLRGDVPRSKYVARILEKEFGKVKKH